MLARGGEDVSPALLAELRGQSARSSHAYYYLARVWLRNARAWAKSGDWDLVYTAVANALDARDSARHQRRMAVKPRPSPASTAAPRRR